MEERQRKTGEKKEKTGKYKENKRDTFCYPLPCKIHKLIKTGKRARIKEKAGKRRKT